MSSRDLKGRLQCKSMHSHKCNKNYALNGKDNSQI